MGLVVPTPIGPAGVIRIRSAGLLFVSAVLKISGATFWVPR